jgi:hypothetical protein
MIQEVSKLGHDVLHLGGYFLSREEWHWLWYWREVSGKEASTMSTNEM